MKLDSGKGNKHMCCTVDRSVGNAKIQHSRSAAAAAATILQRPSTTANTNTANCK